MHSNTFRVIFLLLIALGITFSFPIESLYMPLEAPKLGSLATRDIYAPFDFYIKKTPVELKREREKVLKNISPYLVYDESVTKAVRQSFRQFFDDLDRLNQKGKTSRNLEDFISLYSGLAPQQVKILSNKRVFSRFKPIIISIVDSLSESGIIDNLGNVPLSGNPLVVIVKGKQKITRPRNQVHDISSSINLVQTIISEHSSNRKIVDAMSAAFQFLIRPNLTFSIELTEKAKKEALDAISPYKGMVLEDEPIIRKHERVTEAHLEELKSLATLKGVNKGQNLFATRWFPIIARFLFIGFLIAFASAFIRYFKRDIYTSIRKMLLVALLPIIAVLFTYLLDFQWHLSPYLIPIPLVVMLLTILFDVETGLLMAVVISLLIGVVRNFDFSIAFVSLIVGTVSAYSVRKVRHRHDFYRPILYTTLAYLVSVYSVESLQLKPVVDVLRSCGYGMFNGFISPLLVIALLPLFESVFKITTDITLLELSDLNHPLLKRLSLVAPGTYHHSILMGTLAEEAAKSIGANSLLARVGAYYHDIGKTLKPEYFVENQIEAENKHEKLTPSMSALILESHVKEGREMAKKAGLPQIIIDFIEQHHGDSVMSFFYQKALKTGASEEEAAACRYPGPKPKFKESAIVALADSVEAASRTLDNPTPARMRKLVNKIILDKFISGQLEESNLTISDLHKIEDSFVYILTAIFHKRIKYPENGSFPR